MKFQRSTERPGMTISDVEDFLAEVRRAGATGDEVLQVVSFLRGSGVEEISVKIKRVTGSAEDHD
jgi:hypothetical protein